MRLSNFDIIKFPVITEKSTHLADVGKYVFVVNNAATKAGITHAIEDIFEVKVTKVNILNVKGKAKRFKGRKGKRSDFKKAIVTLAKDNTIDFTGGIK